MSEKLGHLASQSNVCFCLLLSEKAHSLVLPNAKHMNIWKHLNTLCSIDKTSTQGWSD